jgi:hypothetical protein
MLKQISAALIAVSMLAAPAMAASTKTEAAPVTKSAAPAAKLQVKPSVRNANATMIRHHRHHHHHRISAIKTNKVSTAKISAHKTGKISAAKVSSYKSGKISKITVKQGGSATRHG